MMSETRRAAIRRAYRLLRTHAGKTQMQVEASARLEAGRYWKIENGVVFPRDDERVKLARVLRVPESDLPAEHEQQEARSA